MKEIKQKTKETVTYIVCSILFVALTVLSQVTGRSEMSQFNGVLMACQFGICLILIHRGKRKGIIISMVLMGIYLALIIQAMIFRDTRGPLPGLCNTIIYMITLLTIAGQFRIREKEAVTDYMTNLLNRRGLIRLIRKYIEDGEGFHIIFVDIANFRMINDNHGHMYGNELLKVIADRILQCVSKKGTVTRIGGNEFAVILKKDRDPEQIANQLLQVIRERAGIVHNGITVDSYLNAYAGISTFPKDGTQPEELLKFADIAMASAKEDKSLTAYFFNKDMEEKLAREIELEKIIKEGLEKDYFYLVYQPQYQIEGKKLRGFETLIRLRTPDGVMVSPGEFIPVAEKCELIFEIDNYVINRAMREFADVIKNSREKPIISVNVSAKNIEDKDFPGKVKATLEKTGFPPENLEVEITEYCLVQSIDDTVQNIQKLRELGIQVALDDFGTGYTSLSYLNKLPIHLLKIDKSLIDGITTEKKNQDFVHAVISLGHMMGCQVVSEGVETEEQLTILNKQECDYVQGFVWGRPLDYEIAKKMVE